VDQIEHDFYLFDIKMLIKFPGRKITSISLF
jgi:hypothetical protein